MNISEEANAKNIAKECALLLDSKKAEEIVLMDLRNINSYFDLFIITTGNSFMHCRSLARELQKFLKNKNIQQRNNPNMESGWIILDYDEIIIHVFTRELRDYYQLEKLWADATVIPFA